ncbi:MAG: hypothetical protein CMF39_05945 [Legionellaceae bacterium]|nr:hypothetical protein [Legionellaceae bacterium]
MRKIVNICLISTAAFSLFGLPRLAYGTSFCIHTSVGCVMPIIPMVQLGSSPTTIVKLNAQDAQAYEQRKAD